MVTRWLLAASVVCLLGSGCASEKAEPEIVLHPLVEWADVAPQAPQGSGNRFVNLVPGGTDGLFPSSIAVARVTVAEDGNDMQRRVVLDMEPANDFLPFNSLFDTLPYVADAFPLNHRDLAGFDPSPATLCSAAGELSAGLCLVYGQGDASANEARVRGAIYDTRSGAPVAAIDVRPQALSPETAVHPPEAVEADLSHCDARVLATRRFEQLVYDCIRDLKDRDRRVQPQPPEGWTPRGPITPRPWPPSNARRR